MSDTLVSNKHGIDGNTQATTSRLSGKMGSVALMLTVLAFSAPIAVVEGFIPFTILFDGPGASFAFLITTFLLILFAIGYVTMARHVPKPGDFYSFISSGLGKVVGLGASFLSILSYLALLAGTYVFLGVSVSSLIQSLGGEVIPWQVFSLIGWLAVSILGYFHIEMSAKILTVAMIVEVLIVVIYDVFVLSSGGAEGLSLEPMTPSAFMKGDMAVAMLYTTLVFLGFEATALFRDEVKDPDKTIPRATYGAVVFVGVLYTLSCYALVAAHGSEAWEIAKNSPTTMFSHSIGHYVAPIFEQITYCSVVLSLLAALISIHNVLSRYVLNLSVDRVFPTILSKVHSKHSSPHMASISVSAVVILSLMPFIINNFDGVTLYGLAVGLGGVGVIFLMAMVSLAAIVWFVRNGIPESENVFKVFIAPGIACISMLFIDVFAMAHLDLVVGGKPGENTWIIWLMLFTFVIGSSLAVYFRLAKPEIFNSLGRADRVFEFLAEKRMKGAQ